MSDDSSPTVPARSPRAILTVEAVLATVGIVGILALDLPADAIRTSLPAATGWAVVGTLVPLSLVPITLRAESGILGRLAGTGTAVIRRTFLGLPTTRLLLISLAAGVGEELFFRGLLQGGLDGVLGTGWALVVASGLFGLGHWVTPLYALGAALMGALWGGLFIVTGGLAVPVVVHAAYDFGALILATRYLEAS